MFARYFGIDTPIDSTEGKKVFKAMAQEYLPKEAPAAYNQADGLRCHTVHANFAQLRSMPIDKYLLCGKQQ